MRFVTWNVCGLRSALAKGLLDWLAEEDPDVLCLQETRCTWDDLDPAARDALAQDRDVSFFPATSRKGYSGTATLSKKGVGLTHAPGLGVAAFDDEGRVLVSTLGRFACFNVYAPNASRDLVRLPFKRDFSRTLADAVRARVATGQHVIVVGDLNVAPEPIDLARPKDNTKNAGFTAEEREDFALYVAAGLVDVVRERNPGVPGIYTWWSNRPGIRARNVGWRVDHVLATASLRSLVTDVRVLADVMGSDHCPVRLDLGMGA